MSKLETTFTRDDIVRLCERVEGAQKEARPIYKLTEEYPEMTMDDGYVVQNELRKRFIEQGHKLVGWKAGLTSKAKMKQMGVDVPSIGFLTDKMAVPEGAKVSVSELVHPRVECEIAFMTNQDLEGPNCTAKQVLAATDYVLPAIEIIDSRFQKFSFDLQSVIADNGSSARFVGGGRPRYADELILRTIGSVLEKNGEIVEMGAGAAVMDHPAEAVAMLVNILHKLGETLPAGSFVMSGGITAAVAVEPGDSVIARFQHLGSVSVSFVE
ncbi:MAG: 2-oxo-3-hexenedioate decarboxylase [Oceanospirillaceae bacterium]|nr:2-oxo-3-hexenedioate decarboxylase [Oceanospirillaceae bacterium]